MSKLAIIADQIDNTQRTLIHEFIKGHSEDWWHEFLDVWVLISDEGPRWWRDQLKVFVPKNPSSILVLDLDGSRPRWASMGRTGKWEWLKEHI